MKPTRHSRQDPTNGPFGRMYLGKPDDLDLDFRAWKPFGLGETGGVSDWGLNMHHVRSFLRMTEAT